MITVNRHNFRQEVLRASRPVFVNFWVPWSEECKRMRRVMHETAAELDGAVKLVEIDWQRERSLAEDYRVQGIPTLLIFDEGRVVGRYSGILSTDEFLQTGKLLKGV